MLVELEKSVSTEVVELWKRRYVEGYDFTDDHLYNAWKMVKKQEQCNRSYTITSKRGVVTIDADIADILSKPAMIKNQSGNMKRPGKKLDPSNRELTSTFLDELQEAVNQETIRKRNITEAKKERKRKKEKEQLEKEERKQKRDEERIRKASEKGNKQKKKKVDAAGCSSWTDLRLTSPPE